MKNSKMQFAVLLLSTLCLLTGAYAQITGVTAGTDLTGGGTSGNVTLSLNTAKVPQLATANTFTGNQTVNGNLSATGSVTGSGFDIGGEPIAFGSYSLANSFLGFAGNTTMTGNYNAAVGTLALYADTTGGGNTAAGTLALYADTTGGVNTATGNGSLSANTTGNYNTASGGGSLYQNTTGSYNTAGGEASGYTVDSSNITGSFNTFLGFGSSLTTGTLSNATAIGSNAVVSESNALVRRYDFTYALGPTTNRTLLTQVEECAADGVCMRPTRFQFSSSPAGFKQMPTTILTPTSRLASPKPRRKCKFRVPRAA